MGGEEIILTKVIKEVCDPQLSLQVCFCEIRQRRSYAYVADADKRMKVNNIRYAVQQDTQLLLWLNIYSQYV